MSSSIRQKSRAKKKNGVYPAEKHSVRGYIDREKLNHFVHGGRWERSNVSGK